MRPLFSLAGRPPDGLMIFICIDAPNAPRLLPSEPAGVCVCVCVCVCVLCACAAQSLNPIIAFAIIHHFYSSVRTAEMCSDSAPGGRSSLAARHQGYIQLLCVCVRVPRALGGHVAFIVLDTLGSGNIHALGGTYVRIGACCAAPNEIRTNH